MTIIVTSGQFIETTLFSYVKQIRITESFV